MGRIASACVALALAGPVVIPVAAARAPEPIAAPLPAAPVFTEKPQQIAFARGQLRNVALLFDRHFRVAATGQYLDRIDLSQAAQTEVESSIAATGMGLISLVFGDALGVVEGADRKAEVTLANLLGRDPAARFRTLRSPGGWYQHWIDAHTGEALNDSRERFSTIDTTLLAVGASIAGRYFGDPARPHPTPAAARVSTLAAELLDGVDWGQSIKDVDRGTIHALFVGMAEASYPDYAAEPFDEYVLLPCLGRDVERARGVRGPATLYWERHLADVDTLPVKAYQGIEVLSAPRREYVSHFAPEFAFYFCRALRADPKFQRALSRLRDADRRWFQITSGNLYPTRWWGLGAGSVATLDGLVPNGTGGGEHYEATTLDPNDHHVFSPPIIAGFAPLDILGVRTAAAGSPQTWIVDDLMALFEHGECVYEHGELTFLWRCTPANVRRRTRYVQAIDFSTYMLGLASLLPELGLGFYDRYGP